MIATMTDPGNKSCSTVSLARSPSGASSTTRGPQSRGAHPRSLFNAVVGSGSGTTYKASGWIHVETTRGRGVSAQERISENQKRPSGSVRSEKNSQSVKFSTAIKPPPNGYWCGGGGMRRPVRGCLRNRSRRGRCHPRCRRLHLPHRSRRMSRADGKGRGRRMCRT